MKHLILKLDDETDQSIQVDLGMQPLFAALKLREVETIVVGETDSDGNVLWEKQFNAVTVMPRRN